MVIDANLEKEVGFHRDSKSDFAPRKFRQTYNIRIAIAALVFSALYVIWIWKVNSDSTRLTFIWITVGVVLLYGALFVAFEETAVIITSESVRHTSIFGSSEIKWEQITETRYLASPVRARIARGLFGLLIAMLRRRSPVKHRLDITSSDGTKIRISSNVHRAREAIGIVLGQIVPRMVKDAHDRVSRGEMVEFGPLSLSSLGLAWKSGSPIPLAEITQAEIVGRKLRIKSAAGWLTSIRARSDKVPNVLVLLEVLETIAPRLRPSRMDPLARVRL